MTLSLRLSAVLLIAGALGLAPARAADFAAGAEAYDGGRYGEAFAAWHALARKGEARAQVAIAGMHRFGEGRPVDLKAAAAWYRRAARLGDPIAQLNLAEMYEAGLGIPRDGVTAYVWYVRAARQGNAWAAEQAARLAPQLSAADREQADRRLAR